MSEFPKYREPALGQLPEQKLRTEFREELDARFVEHESGIVGLKQDMARVHARVFGCGRILGTDAEENEALAPRAGIGLTVQLPAGWEGLIQGLPFLAGDPEDETTFVVLEDVPAGVVSYGVLALDEESEVAIEWLTQAEYSAQRAQLLIEGKPCIGKVTAGASDITSIDLAFEDVIWSGRLVQARITALMLSGGGGGSGGGAAYASTLPVTPENPTDTYSYFSDLIADLNSRIGEGGGAGEPIPQPLDVIADNLNLTLAGVGEVNPRAVERPQISIVGKEFGHGQNDTPDFTPDTNDPLELPFDEETGLFGP